MGKSMNQGSIGNSDSNRSVGDWDDTAAAEWTLIVTGKHEF